VGDGQGEGTLPLFEAFYRLVALLDEPDDIPILAPLVQREILYRLVMSDQGARLRQIASVGSPSHQAAWAISWLKAHFAEPLRIDDLASRLQMSPSAFHHHFRSLTAMSPLQYQKWLRLSEARRLMLGEHLDATTAAFRVGYESPSQFSREYRRLFGAPPSRDIASCARRPPAGSEEDGGRHAILSGCGCQSVTDPAIRQAMGGGHGLGSSGRRWLYRPATVSLAERWPTADRRTDIPLPVWWQEAAGQAPVSDTFVEATCRSCRSGWCLRRCGA
jgi:AraC-like DNA-binding protein